MNRSVLKLPLAIATFLLMWHSSAAAIDAMVSAKAGRPFGVAAIEIPLASTVSVGTLPPLQISEPGGRIFYPAESEVRVAVLPPSEMPVPQPGRGRLLRRVGSLIREITDPDRETEMVAARRVSFLFTGTEPMIIRVADHAGEIGRYELIPQSDDFTHQALLGEWWSEYTKSAKQQMDRADYPPWVESYLIAMLSSRLRLPLPDWYQAGYGDEDTLLSTLKLIGGAEEQTEIIFRRAALGHTQSAAAADVVSLPRAPRWESSFDNQHFDIPDAERPQIESLANSVPPECFYIRYGSFENYLWFQDLSTEYGGDLTRMATLRGFRGQGPKAIESQLNLKMTELSRMLGPTVIEDQAIIGTDLFWNDGATIGVLFKPKNAFLLRTSLQNDRTALARTDESIELSSVTINGQNVSFLRTADNRVRSFLVESSNCILVTNSEFLAGRFLEVAQSGESLASTPEFRMSRQLMPIERNDTLFAYFSPRMLQNLLSPESMIELRRRLQSKAETTLVHLARLAAAAEGNPIQSIDRLMDQGYLPTSFRERSDGSGVVSLGDDLIDTLRGARGSFLPIADVPIRNVTAEEASWYNNIASSYSTRFPRMDPIMVGVQRETLSGENVGGLKIERLQIHAEIAPWSPEQYGKLAQQLGPPTNVAIQFAPDDIVAVQAHVASEYLGPPTHLFAAIKDSTPPSPDQFDGLLKSYRALKQLPGYLGAWPFPGAIDRLPLGLGRGTPVEPGLSRLIGGLYRYTGGEFSVLSFYRDVLNASLPFLASVEVDDVAQVRVRSGNLTGSQLEGWVTDQLYQRSAIASEAGANFLSLLSRQLKVPAEDAASSTHRLLQSDLQCTLGGEYEYDAERNHWTSTAWQGAVPPASPPAGYTPPLLQWFRGGQATLTQYQDRLVVDAVIDAARANEPKE